MPPLKTTQLWATHRVGAKSAVKIIFAIVVIASVLRFFDLGQLPAGINVDEASNGWNAYTLLKTGKDQHGVAWPIFYTRAFGENRSVSYIYALLPFQAFAGLSVQATRLPAAFGGVLSILLIYFVGARLFGHPTGLVAAAMLAMNPWHLQISRLGVEALLVPLLVLASLTALLWADFPFGADDTRGPKPIRAALAGLILGVSCFGYWAVRIFLPLFFVGAVAVTWQHWWHRLKTRDGAIAIGCLALAITLVGAPLLWRHLSDPEIAKRGRIQGWVWEESDSFADKATKALARYPGHFGPDFLFINGDNDPAYSPLTGAALFHWYDLPLLILGLIVCLRQARASPPARLLLLWLLLYPLADLFARHSSLHALRSLPGLPALVLLAAIGAVHGTEWLWRRRSTLAPIGYALLGLVAVFNFIFLKQFYLDRKPSAEKFYANQVDHFQACEWLRPQLGGVDAVFWTGSSAHRYIYTVICLGYEPEQWFRDVREIVPGPLPGGVFAHEDIYLRVGKFHFMFGDQQSRAALTELLHNDRPDRVMFVVRPGDLGLHKTARPIHEVLGPDGKPTLWIFDTKL
ncbi:MAG: phospholipid carrier-dependent glycosyltransferase [Deltaproteobacteria bacterium]|nr:phospholipid carrier-dependent glycosyltransferase [Deltaproteobacteria bacterium]